MIGHRLTQKNTDITTFDRKNVQVRLRASVATLLAAHLFCYPPSTFPISRSRFNYRAISDKSRTVVI